MPVSTPSLDYQAYIAWILSYQKTEQIVEKSLFRWVPRVQGVGIGEILDNYLWIIRTLSILQGKKLLDAIEINIYTLEGNQNEKPVSIGSLKADNTLAISAMTNWEESMSKVLIQKDLEFVEVRGSINKDKIDTFLQDIATCWSEWKFHDGLTPDVEKEIIRRRMREERYSHGEREFVLDISTFAKGVHIFPALLRLSIRNGIILFSPSETLLLNRELPKTYKIKVLKDFRANTTDTQDIQTEHIFEFDFSQDQLKYNGKYMAFRKKNLDFVRVFFDLLSEWRDYISTDDILLGAEDGYSDASPIERHKWKKQHVYYPRTTVNEAIEEESGLSEFFTIRDENIFLTYPHYIAQSKNS